MIGNVFRITFTAALLLACGAAIGKETSQAILDPAFRTLRVEKEGDFLASPSITLGSQERILFSFDEIASDYSQLRFRLIHCNADWQPSRLLESEYLDGFNEAEIEDYAFSSNTFVQYVNYQFAIPSGRMQPLVSGNYLVEIFRQEDPDDVVARARFSVSENAAGIAGNVTTRTDNGVNSEWQQLLLSVNPGVRDINPYADLLLTVTQNGRPDSQHLISRPLRVDGSTLIYEHMPELIYPAGNEYRRFETVRSDYPGMGIDSISFSGRSYHAWLRKDTPRADRQYSYDSTQRGRYKIDEYNASDPDLGADYIVVHFDLDFPELIDADIYVEGALTDRSLTDRNRMTYDRQLGRYTLSLPLKQGSYNYQYVARRRNSDSSSDPSPIEGNKYETVNEYNIQVWLRHPMLRADRLLGTATILNL